MKYSEEDLIGHKSGVSRADLLWGLQSVGPEQHERLAALLGFEKKIDFNDRSDTNNLVGRTGDNGDVVPETDPPEESGPPEEIRTEDINPAPSAINASYYRIASRAVDPTRPRSDREELSLPDLFAQAKPTLLQETTTRIPKIHQIKPQASELTAWSRLLPFLQRVLGNRIEGRRPDTVKLVKQAAQCEMIRKIPHKQRYGWSSRVRLLIDINEDNFPYRRDFLQLRDRLLQELSHESLDVQYVYDEPGGHIARYQQQQKMIEPWSLPERCAPILILSDLGMHTQSRQSLYGWLAFGQRLKAQGIRATVLMPVAERNIDSRLLRFFDCVIWDNISRLKSIKGDYRTEKDKRNHAQSIDQLLSYFFAAVRSESGLLRALRHALPGNYDIGHEAAIWQHAAVVSVGDEWGWQASSKSKYLDQAQQLSAALSPAQQQQLIELIGRYHALYPDELYFEAMHDLQMLGLKLPEDVKAAMEAFMEDMVATYRDNVQNSLLHSWVKRHLARHDEPIFRQKHDYYLPFLAYSRMQDARLNGETETEWPEGLTQSELENLLRYINHAQAWRTYWLRQEGEKLTLLAADHQPESTSQQNKWTTQSRSGALVLALRLNDTRIFHVHDDDQEHQRISSLDLTETGKNTFRFPTVGKHTFQIGGERFTLDVMAAQQQKQDWMRFIGSGSEGLYAEFMNLQNEVYRWYWHPPEWNANAGILPGFWFNLPVSAASLKPDWAVAAGHDQFGLYADVEIFKIPQRLRWIEPTSFLMGSPESEAGRYDDELQHQVILTQGYWLAETACTQALWEAVMHSNPSEFKGEMRPVENVSWNEIQNFLEQLSKQHSELNLRLPTEAEWENACRAGTTGAFNFDGELSLDKVNYRGTWEYESDKWGEGALKETVDVKSYPPNAWGLYEMHGNVWEWCQDWFGDYPAEPVIDPQGTESGDSRVLRGGSWVISGGLCRSARRDHGGPSLRVNNTGFRLARGHELQSVRSVRAGQQPDGSHAGGARGGQTGDGLRGGKEQKGILDRFKDLMK